MLKDITTVHPPNSEYRSRAREPILFWVLGLFGRSRPPNRRETPRENAGPYRWVANVLFFFARRRSGTFPTSLWNTWSVYNVMEMRLSTLQGTRGTSGKSVPQLSRAPAEAEHPKGDSQGL